MGISNVDRLSTDIQNFLQTIDDSTSAVKGYVKLTSESNASYIIYAITASHIHHGNHFDLPISYVSGTVSGTFTNNENILLI